MPSAIVADAVHWLVGDSSEVLQFHLKTRQLQLIGTPVDIGDGEFTLFPTKLDTLDYAAVPLPVDNVALSYSDDFDEDIVYRDQNYGFVPSSNFKVIGFVEEANAVLLRVVGMGVFMIDIETSCRKKVADYQNYHIVYPYSSFYTGVGKTIFSEAVSLPNTENNGTESSGETDGMED
ncbi:hypothetical protein GUJ93_ZPchr0010g11130 [Zizania palustris]|uniref:Uncharacterized protein n=1 Tax=Zizania palustris TaxID=103762 RepID=A0A8J5WC90_ZIZPA|nr:hypothetical protein GUJ93_ZPchr0010g11130 [Zizania palustris]